MNKIWLTPSCFFGTLHKVPMNLLCFYRLDRLCKFIWWQKTNLEAIIYLTQVMFPQEMEYLHSVTSTHPLGPTYLPQEYCTPWVQTGHEHSVPTLEASMTASHIPIKCSLLSPLLATFSLCQLTSERFFAHLNKIIHTKGDKRSYIILWSSNTQRSYRATQMTCKNMQAQTNGALTGRLHHPLIVYFSFVHTQQHCGNTIQEDHMKCRESKKTFV